MLYVVNYIVNVYFTNNIVNTYCINISKIRGVTKWLKIDSFITKTANES